MKHKMIGASFSALAILTLPSHGVFTLLDNFEGYTAGTNANGVGGWTATGDTQFVADPSNPANIVLSSTHAGATTNVYKSMPTITDASTGTIFFRARATTTADFVIGSSDVAAPSGWADFEGYMRFTLDTANGNTNDIDVRDGGGFAAAGTYVPDEWYNVWLVLDHAADTATLYVNQGSGDATTAAGSGAFRTSGNAVHDDITTFFLRSNRETFPGLIDDIYVDTTGANLSNPVSVIPEPATSLLALVGLAFGMRRRRS